MIAPLIEDSESCYKRLITEVKSPKFKTALRSIKTACDNIEEINGKMTIQAVARLADLAPETISNAKSTHRVYVKLRIEQYERKLSKPQEPKKDHVKSSDTQMPKYPAADLDDKTRRFIDRLWLEINSLKSDLDMEAKAKKELQKVLNTETLKKPLAAEAMIRAGADEEGAIAIIKKEDNNSMPEDLKHALSKILDIHKRIGKPFLLSEQGSLLIDTPSRQAIILLANEMAAIERALVSVEDQEVKEDRSRGV